MQARRSAKPYNPGCYQEAALANGARASRYIREPEHLHINIGTRLASPSNWSKEKQEWAKRISTAFKSKA